MYTLNEICQNKRTKICRVSGLSQTAFMRKIHIFTSHQLQGNMMGSYIFRNKCRSLRVNELYIEYFHHA